MIISDEHYSVEIHPRHWPLAADLFIKWGHKIQSDKIDVIDVNDITPELSVWGVPWKYIKE